MGRITVSLAPGSSIPDLDLTPINPQSAIERKNTKLFFIFKSPCSACNANLAAWKRLTQYLGKKIEISGIILDGSMEAQRLMDEKSVNFQLYVPENIESFKEQMHIRLNMAQTIIAADNKVKLIRLGTLNFTDIEGIIKTINNTLKGT